MKPEQPSESDPSVKDEASVLPSLESQLNRYRPVLVRLATMELGKDLQARIDPSDVVQEALLAASAGQPPTDENGEFSLFNWLCRLVRQRIVDAHRFHTRNRRSIHREQSNLILDDGSWMRPIVEAIVDHTAGPGSRVLRMEQVTHMERAISQLSDSHRELLRLKYEVGLKTNEIAEALQISESAVKMRHLRIIEALRDAIDQS